MVLPKPVKRNQENAVGFGWFPPRAVESDLITFMTKYRFYYIYIYVFLHRYIIFVTHILYEWEADQLTNGRLPMASERHASGAPERDLRDAIT